MSPLVPLAVVVLASSRALLNIIVQKMHAGSVVGRCTPSETRGKAVDNSEKFSNYHWLLR